MANIRFHQAYKECVNMATKMKSFRLDEWTAKTIEQTAEEMGISQANVISLAVEAFKCYGVDIALNNADYKDNSAAAYSTLIEMSHHGENIYYEITKQINACARA